MTKTPYITTSCDAEFRANAEEGRKYRENSMKTIIENGEEMEVTESQMLALMQAGLIYDSGENYYHLQDGVTFDQVDAYLG